MNNSLDALYIRAVVSARVALKGKAVKIGVVTIKYWLFNKFFYR